MIAIILISELFRRRRRIRRFDFGAGYNPGAVYDPGAGAGYGPGIGYGPDAGYGLGAAMVQLMVPAILLKE